MKMKFSNMILDNNRYLKSKSFIIGIIISITLLLLAFKDFNYDYFIESIKNIVLYKILVASFLLMLAVYFRGLRWNYIIQKESISTYFLFKGQLIGYFINNVFPLRAGEFIKAYYVGNKINKSKSFVLGTVFLERFFDFIGLIFLIFILFNSRLLDVFIQNFLYAFITVLIIILVSLLLIYALKNNFFKNKIKSNFHAFIFNIFDGFSKVKNINILISLFLTLIIWGIYILEVYLVQSAFNINLGLYEVVFILLVSSVSMFLPAAPGNFGTFEAAIVYSFFIFEKYNIGIYNDILGFSFILHLVSYIPYTIFGFIYCIQDTKFLLIKNK